MRSQKESLAMSIVKQQEYIDLYFETTMSNIGLNENLEKVSEGLAPLK